MNIIEAWEDPNLFQPHFAAPSRDTWRTVMRAISHGNLNAKEHDIYYRVSGRKTVPSALRGCGRLQAEGGARIRLLPPLCCGLPVAVIG
jgi:hypothetical protein